jgi:hypothetical protein
MTILGKDSLFETNAGGDNITNPQAYWLNPAGDGKCWTTCLPLLRRILMEIQRRHKLSNYKGRSVKRLNKKKGVQRTPFFVLVACMMTYKIDA